MTDKTKFPTVTHYSPHFTKKELRCHCGCTPSASVDGNLYRLAWKLETLRHEVGDVSLHVNSGHRCPAYNKKIGGAENSQHMYGNAADLSSAKASPELIAKKAALVPGLNGIGLYDTFCHTDQRSWLARWDDRKGK